MIKLLTENKLILKEGAVVERLRRMKAVQLHPRLVNAPLIYDDNGRKALSDIYNGYIHIAQTAKLPFLMCTPTWRTNKARVSETNVNNAINIDAVRFLKSIKATHPFFATNIKIGGLIGCKNDCYKPEEGLPSEEAESFHAWQIDELLKGGVDFIVAETMPNIQEALGIAKYLSTSKIPYFISFVISRDGLILDGNTLLKGIDLIDNEVANPPLGYTVNCAYPTFLCAYGQPQTLWKRFVGFSGNGSSLDHCDLDSATDLQRDSISDWGDKMLALNRTFGVQILGGCCGTGEEHLKYLIEN